MALKVLSALDTAKTQYYHFKAIIIAGMGLFTDAYDLFCITPIMIILGRVYYPDDPEIPTSIFSTMIGLSFLGTVIGQLVFGRLGDKIGRRSVYGLSLMLMVVSSMACGFSICTTKRCVLGSLGFFRFFLGLGIGGDYPLSATIMSEFANKRTRGAFIAGVFSMQGFGILAGSAVTMVVCAVFANIEKVDKDRTPATADIAWRLILMLGAVPAALTYYWRMMMPETARYTALVEQNVLQAANDMKKVLKIPMTEIEEEDHYCQFPSPPPSYTLFSKRFLRRHGRNLFACAATWFLVDMVFYSSNLFQSQIYNRYIPKKDDVSVYRETFEVAMLQTVVAAASTIPGYYFTVYFIDRIGRVNIQIMGFLCMSLVYFGIGIPYTFYWGKDHTNIGFMFLYGLTFFFANFGPNTTTFIVPAELFPARLRSTCHGISGATGKVGAMVGSIGFLCLSQNGHENGNPSEAGMTSALVILGGACILGMVVTYLFTIETMGRSLEDNEKEEEEEGNGFCFVRSLPMLINQSCSSAGDGGDHVSTPAAS